MKKIILMSLILLIGLTHAEGRKKKDILNNFDYRIEAFGVGIEGHYAVKVFSKGRNVKKAKREIASNAIHGILFKGVMGNKTGPSQPPLVDNFSNSVTLHSAFYNSFFSTGAYQRFISKQSTEILPGDCHRLSKGYEVGLTLIIDVQALRSYLENEKIITPLW